MGGGGAREAALVKSNDLRAGQARFGSQLQDFLVESS